MRAFAWAVWLVAIVFALAGCAAPRAPASGAAAGTAAQPQQERLPPQQSAQQIVRPAGPVTKELLQGEWVSERPLRLGSGTLALKGILFSAREAVAYDRLSIDRLRLFPSAFDYAADATSLRLTVTFSAAGLEKGTRVTVPARFDANGQLVLGTGVGAAVYRIQTPGAPLLWGTAMASDPAMNPPPLPAQADEFKRRAVMVAELAGAAGSVGFNADLCGQTFPEVQADTRAGYRTWQERNRGAINIVEAYLMALDKASERTPGRKPEGTPLGEAIRSTAHAPQPQLRDKLLQDRSGFAAFCQRYPAELRTTKHDLEVTQAALVRTLREGAR
ncbi:MAG: hypothetical protein JNL85_01165 [Rubrivivax sp.]|nr:hypothetical protein [Rubrivivax sp.]